MIFGAGQGQGESETGRLEAFSDGVLAVIITIMALELKAPEGETFHSLRDRLPALLFYILSFTFVGIYWNNHHHLLRAARRISAGVMWANLHLLFWLSLIPVLTEWVGEHHTKTAPAATYGVVGLGSAVAFTILVQAIIRADGSSSLVATAIGSDTRLAAGVCGRDRAGVRVPVDLLRSVRRGGGDVVHPRPPPQPGEHGRLRRLIPRAGPAALHRVAPSSQSAMLRARTGIGSEPWSSTAAWNAGSENAGPSRCLASSLIRRISSLPVR
jgi:uncharacterized membrane protein